MNIAKGRIVFSKRTDGNEIPVQGMRVELWDLDLIRNDFLQDGYTRADGSFELEYDPEDAGGRWDKPDLVLRLLDREYTYDKLGNPTEKWSVVASFDGDRNVTDAVYNFGRLEVAYWEYEDPDDLTKVGFTPRVTAVDGRVPQSARTGHAIAQAAAALKNGVKFAKFNVINNFSPERPTVAELDQYIPNLTREMGRDKSRSDEYLSEIVLNGFNPCVPRVEDGKYVVSFQWDGITQDGRHFAPNTKATFRLDHDEFVLESISVQKRRVRAHGDFGAHAVMRPEKTYTPTSENWDEIKRLFRVNYFAFGEVNTHLTATHLNIEQYNVAIRRHLHRSPVARLLMPHFYGTVAVNLGANDLLITESGLVGKGTALTPDSVEFVSRNHLGGLNWAGWSPRQPICSSHRFANLGLLYWELLTEYVDTFFTDNLSEIKEFWAEILSMSEEMVRRAVPYVDDGDTYYDLGEINTSDLPHPVVGGTPVAISPVTAAAVADDGGIDNLKQLCRCILFHTTFKHSWVNDRQFDIGGEVTFASLGVVGDLTGGAVLEDKAVPPDEALLQPFITYLLSYTRYGYIIRNEDDDMNPDLIAILKNNRDRFEELKFNIRDIRSCINT